MIAGGPRPDRAKGKRILLVRDGDFFVHVQTLAELLARSGHEVEVVNTSNADPEPLYADLVEKTRRLGIACHLVQDRAGWLERKLVALAYRLRIVTRLGAVTPYKIRHARKAIAGKRYDLVIAFDPTGLFLACKLFPDRLADIILYSLEISDESHRDFQTSRTERSFRLFERSTLPGLRALMIQDRFRMQVLLRRVPGSEKVRTIFFPVAMSGPARQRASGLPNAQTARVLFFGGLWSEAFLRELEQVAVMLRDRQVLVIQGGRGRARLGHTAGGKLEISTLPIPFDNVNDFIATGDIGLAVYPNDEPNSRCSAFASEKVARYLQCGIPFIAFHNEDYAYLRSETGCCELVSTYAGIPAAVDVILNDYRQYQTGAVAAFERFYRLETTSVELLRQIGTCEAHAA